MLPPFLFVFSSVAMGNAQKQKLADRILSAINLEDDPRTLNSLHFQLIEVYVAAGNTDLPACHFRELVKSNIQLVDEGGWCHDEIRTESIDRMLRFYPEGAHGALYSFLVRTLRSGGFAKDEAYYLNKWNGWRARQALIGWNPLKAFLFYSVSSVTGFFVSIFSFFTLQFVVLLSAPFELLELFVFTPLDISSHWVLNHTINAAYVFLGIAGPKLVAANWVGASLLIIWRLFYFLIIANIVIEAIKRYLKTE